MSRKRRRVWSVHGVFPPLDRPAYVIGQPRTRRKALQAARRNQREADKIVRALRESSASTTTRTRPAETPGGYIADTPKGQPGQG